MNGRQVLLAGAVSALLGATAGARTQEIRLWRGETRAVVLADCIETGGAAPAGLTLREGALRRVKFAVEPEELGKAYQYAEAADRVAWGEKGDGHRVLEVSAAADARPGTNRWGDVSIVVVDRVLPPAKEWKYYLDLWQHPWAVSRVNGVKPFSKEHYAAMRPVWELLATAAQKTLTVSLIEQPWDHQCFDAYHPMVRRTRTADGAWTFDYSLFDEYVEFGRSCGLGPHISCYTLCPWGYLVSWEEDGKLVRRAAKPGEPFFDEYWAPFLRDFARHLKEKGWFDDTFISMDERSPEDVRYISAFVRREAPGLRLSMAGYQAPSDYKDIVLDSYTAQVNVIDDRFLADAKKRRAEGKITLHYVCCGPAHPNTFMDSPAGEAFWLGFYPAAVGLDGFLRWAWNSWGADTMTDASFGNWRSGDVFLVYPDGSPSLRFLDLRNGIAQAEKFRILQESGERADELKVLAAKFDRTSAVNATAKFLELRKEALDVLNR